MRETEIFGERPGRTDDGKNYQNITIANIVLQMVSDDKVNNFEISSNDDDFGAFDDVIIKLELDNKTEIKAMQLKHSHRKTLLLEHLTSKKGEFSISKYFESYQELKNKAQEFIIFTNRPFDVAENTTFQLEEKEFYVRPVKLHGRLEISKNLNYCYKFEIVENAWTADNFSKIKEYKTFFENFYLYTNQEDFDTLKISTIEMFKTKFSSNEKVFDEYFRIISEWNMQEGNKEELEKKWMQRAIALQLLSSQIEPLCFGPVNDKMRSLRDAISTFDVTLLEEKCVERVTQLWGDYLKENIDINKVNKIRSNYRLGVDDIDANNIDNVDLKLFSQLLWLMDECPLIIHENENVGKAIRLCANQKFILLGDSTNKEWLKDLYLFQNLSNLKSKQKYYEKVMHNFTITIQGKEEVNLMTAFGGNEEFLENVSTTDLVEMLNGPRYIDGTKETLAEPYVERSLYVNVIDSNFLEKGHEKTIIILNCANNFHMIKEKLKGYTIIDIDELPKEKTVHWESMAPKEFRKYYLHSDVFMTEKMFNIDKSHNCKKIYISNSNFLESKLKKIYRENEEINNFHYFKLLSDGNLEWVKSKGEINDLESCKLSNRCVIHENVLWSQLVNNINVITGDAGVGKTELMKSFRNNCSPKCWTVTIHPKDVHSFFKSLTLSETSNYSNLFNQFIVNEKCRSLETLDKCFFELCLKQNNVFYVWEALDEISSEHLDAVSTLILQLSKTHFFQWVTSRQHLKSFLERKLNVLSFSITQFNEQEQEDYIRKRLATSICEIDATIQKIKSSSILIEHVDILGIPLQIFMLTELLRRNNDLTLLNSAFLLTDLYEYYIEEKFNIFYKTKICFNIQTSQQEQKIEDKKQEILKHHEILATRLIFPELKLNLLSSDDHQKFSELYESLGIITDKQNGIPHFLHSSFAEYFAAKYFYKNLKDVPENIFFEQKYINVRFFFDMLLAKNSPAHIAVLHKSFDLIKTFDDDILSRKDEGGRTALHLICSWGQKHPRVKIQRENETYIVKKPTNYNYKPDTKEFLEALVHLKDKNHISQCDTLLNVAPLLYAKKSENLGAELCLLKHETTMFQSCTPSDRINILYYSAVLGYDHVVELFASQKLCISSDEMNFVTENFHDTALTIACAAGNEKIVEFLVSCGAEINRADNKGATPLFIASEKGHEKIVEYLVKSGAEINRANNDGRTPLWIASFNGHEKTVIYLVKSGAEINSADSKGSTPLFVASEEGHENIVDYLVKSGAEINRANNDGWQPLHIASHMGQDNTVEYLVKFGVEINSADDGGATPLYLASEKGQEKAVEYLVKSGAEINSADDDGWTPLQIACHNGHEKTVQHLVKCGAEINSADNDGSTPLFVACEEGHEKIAEFLVKSGADINLADNYGWLPLQIASYEGREKIVDYLLKSGAEINIGARTPLWLACFNRHEETVISLVKSGAEINCADYHGYTPLCIASEEGQEKIVEYLVKSGADINSSNGSGFTPLYIASEGGHEKIVRHLLKSGADINRANMHGRTPLWSASSQGHERIVAHLVENGAEINRADDSGSTPVRVASEDGHDKIVEYLVKSGAETNSADSDD